MVNRLKTGEKNIGMIDCMVRIIIVLIAAFVPGRVTAPGSCLVVLIGLTLLITGAVRTAPILSGYESLNDLCAYE